CNSYNATVELDNQDIKIGAIASTKLLCPHTGEAVFFQTLEKINKISVSDEQLTLIMRDIAMMRFKKLKNDTKLLYYSYKITPVRVDTNRKNKKWFVRTRTTA